MSAIHSASTNETQIRSLLGQWEKTLRAKDTDGIMALCAPEFVCFDLAPSHKYGVDRARLAIATLFDALDEVLSYEVRDLDIMAGDDLGFCHASYRLHAKRKDGGVTDLWFRSTLCFRKVDGHWRVSHEHASLPMDLATGKVLADLEP
ncbi:YybH family protein [Chondromyces crocatus]|uniref:Ketosteroid isomerase n=1 Tax=Chondromyces crocatus TaxID=52 RepID=A0A0K1ESZ8_CHOCO|nr:nuclear transport factor 2 family protein [Chondromyces crocatus]AKT43767.1 ketosteroid isomerase [Chondromyces crocatus]